jgi:hypothetical protein
MSLEKITDESLVGYYENVRQQVEIGCISISSQPAPRFASMLIGCAMK